MLSPSNLSEVPVAHSMIVTSSISVFERLPVIRPWKTTNVRWQMLMISGSSEETTMIASPDFASSSSSS